jgi:hydroxyacylglutathione hydrolase
MALEIVTFPGGPVQTNAYLVAETESGEALVIDAPHETTDSIVEAARERGWHIGQIVITHTHWDHVADAAALVAATNAPLLAHPLAVDRLASPSPLFEPPVPVPPVATSGTLEDGDTVNLGGHAFRVMHLPGHEPAHIALIDDASGVMLGGDVLFPGGHGRTDIPGSDQQAMNRSLRRLVAELPAEMIVYPGHGATTTIGAETPWIALLTEPEPADVLSDNDLTVEESIPVRSPRRAGPILVLM